MDARSSSRLRYIGYVVLALCVGVIIAPMFGVPKVDFSEALGGLAAIGVGMLLLAEIGPFLKSFKAGGVEVEFVETLADKFNALEKRIAALELAPAAPTAVAVTAEVPPSTKGPPAAGRPVTDREDQNHGRFGGKAQDKGYALSASFVSGASGWVDIRLKVTAPSQDLDPLASAEFYLHDTFDPDMFAVPFVKGEANTSVLAYGGFTVGVWIPAAGVELELDLSKVRGAPRVIRDN